ncbi:putative tyrosine kinase-like protein [Tenacibaculum lutimaris]|uniref:Putative tyrosine kinase-like protein n=1 Tax=Tenacibaculum lutimaris TaxID=285258 RepID=A0A420DYH0_9FLAO|nr:Wzz/FepE/Etk N-terminal domain-containing protein [Tenacibaculum lutimaris]RKF02817.1 putative tyrosine kinase-like protein [Tenacibaculum lutimaris]
MESKTKYTSNDEINLLEIFKTIWEGRKIVVKFLIVFGLLGVFIAVFSAKEYTAFTTLVPQTSDSKVGGNLGGLAAMAGINLGGGGSTESIPPTLYPKIVQSVTFQRELLKTPLKFSNVEKVVTYQEYYVSYTKFNLLKAIKEYTIGLPGKIITFFKSDNETITEAGNDSIYRITKKESKLFKKIQEQLVIENNEKEGFVKISFSMPEALAAAQMTKKVQVILQEAITKFKIEKAEQELNFIQQRYSELKLDFEKKQATLASYKDRNQGLITSRSQSYLRRIESEYNLAFNLYSELAKQLETQKIKVKENTPVFTVIEPVIVPVEKSKPRRLMILFIFFFLGIAVGVGVVVVKNWIKEIKAKQKYLYH